VLISKSIDLKIACFPTAGLGLHHSRRLLSFGINALLYVLYLYYEYIHKVVVRAPYNRILYDWYIAVREGLEPPRSG